MKNMNFQMNSNGIINEQYLLNQFLKTKKLKIYLYLDLVF